ncbi:MAG TPA: PAS domain S-box protein [Burkholderiales bacterium]|jgi:PAS domain S-box-containing protein|nr:PAS domain S-box protein [Burkholderiales bacterium]
MGAPEVRRTLPDNADERFFRMLADAVPHLVWSKSVDGFEDYSNRRLCEYTGMSARELAGSGWEAMVHPEDLERCRCAWSEARARGTRYEVEYRLRRHDGAYLWHHGTAEPLRVDGRIVRWFGTCTDIDARKRAQEELAQVRQRLESLVATRTEALRASETRLREIIDRQPECVKLLDAEGRLLDMNPAGLAMIEADGLEQVQGRCIYGVVAAEHREAFRDLTESVCRGERGTLEFELIGFKGARRWMQTHAAPFRDESRGQTLLLAITRDVTSRKLAERALAESEARFRSFMDSMPAVAWIKDSAFRYTWINEGYRVRRRRTLEQVMGRDDFEIRHESVARLFRERDEEALRRNGPVQSLLEDKGEDGAAVHWLVVRFPVPDASGAMGVGGIAFDISERIELERALRENEARVVEATETVRQLMNRLMHAQEAERHRVAGDLHDLIGQKLTALGINLDIVRQQMPQAGASAVAGRLYQMTTLLAETIGAVRGLISDLRPQVLDEHGLSAALHQYAAAFEARTGLRVEVTGAERRLPLPREVAIALFRIAQEALTNVAKHSGAARAQVRVRKNGQSVEMLVEDDGRGLGEAALAGRHTGAGWGLRMMRERAEAVGGRLELSSAHPGMRVVVEVPLSRADQRHPG